MRPPTAPSRLSDWAARRRQLASGSHADAGFSMMELVVAVIVSGIVISMVAVIMATYFTQSAQTLRTGQATEAGESAMQVVDQYMRESVAPSNATSAAAASGQTTTDCWGTQNPGSWTKTGVTLLGSDGSLLSVVRANDFDLWFCGYNKVSSSEDRPVTYEITIPKSTCGTGVYCTLEVLDWGQTCNPGTIGLATNKCAATGAVAQRVTHVWCTRTYCQGNLRTLPVETINGKKHTVAIACVDWLVTTKPCAGATPPLFAYYAATTGAENQSRVGSLNQTKCASGCFTLDLESSTIGKRSPAISALETLREVVTNFTVLTKGSSNVPTTSQHRVSLSNQVYLANLTGTTGVTTSCNFNSAVESRHPAVFWPMTTLATPPVKVATVATSDKDYGTVAGTVKADQSPGPLQGCQSSSPAFKFSGGYFHSHTLTRFTGATATVKPATMSIVAWFKTKTTGGILQFATKTTPSNYDRGLWVDAAGNLVWGTCGTSCPQVLHSSQSVENTKWNMVVATIGASGKYLYLNGQLVADNPSVVKAQTFNGYWQVGRLAKYTGWPATYKPGRMNFTGYLGRVAYITRALSATTVDNLYKDANDVTACYAFSVAQDNPYAFYTLNTASATAPTVHDTAPLWVSKTGNSKKTAAYNGAQSAATATAWKVLPTVAGKTKYPLSCDLNQKAHKFNGADYVNLAQSTATKKLGTTWTPKKALTVEAWVYFTKTTGNPRVIAADHTDCKAQGFQLEVAAGGTSGFFDVGADAARATTCTKGATDVGTACWKTTTSSAKCPDATSPLTKQITSTLGKIATTTWYFLAGTYDGLDVRYYIDGTQVASAPFTKSITCSVCKVSIGYDPGTAGTYLNGYVADTAIFTTALTGTQIQFQYEESGAG